MQNKFRIAVVLPFVVLLAIFRLQAPDDLKVVTEKSAFLETFPLEIGGWTGVETPPDERTLEILETRNVLSREYKDPDGNAVHLLLVSSDKDRRVAHPPEVCYLGSNYNITKEETHVIQADGQSIEMREFEASPERYPERVEEVGYFYKIGDAYTMNYYKQQLQFAFDRLTRAETKVMLIRAAGKSRESVRTFLEVLVPYLNEENQA